MPQAEGHINPEIDTPLDTPDLEAEEARILGEARKRYDNACVDEQDNWEEAIDDLRFAAGDQWPKAAKQARDTDNRPCLTINKMGQYTRQVTGDMRLNKASIKVSPVDDQSDPELAQIMQGLIRNIEVQSKAQIAYVQAGKNAALCGMGAFRVVSEYVSDDSFEQHLRIRAIRNPFAVVWDPGAQELCREDANYCFVTSRIPLADFKAAFPKAKITDFSDFERENWYGTTGWVSSETVRIAEYWEKKPKNRIMALLPGGRTVDVTQLDPNDYGALGVIKTRQVMGYEICQYLINGAEILDGPNIWPGKYIPIIPVWGEEIHLGDKTYRYGMVRFAKDPQRMYNFHMSQATETTALAPKAPVVATVTQLKGQEANWAASNKQPLPYLLYNADAQAPGPPQRLDPPQFDVANMQLATTAAQDMQSVIGIYNASLGQKSSETSGKAINARDRQADVGTFEYIDNLSYGIAHCGTILVDLIPRIYDTERVVRILGEDDETDNVRINAMDPQTGRLVNDLGIGQYDVVVETGPSFSTRRQEAAESMMEFMRVSPEIGRVIVDIVAKNMNWPGHEQVVNRLKKLLPEGIDDEPPKEGEPPPPPPPPPPEVVAQMEAAQRQQQLDAQKQANEADKNALEHEKNEIEKQKLANERLKLAQDFTLQRGEALARGAPVQDLDGEGAPTGGNPFDQVAAAIAAMAQAQAQNTQMIGEMIGQLTAGLGQMAQVQAQTAGVPGAQFERALATLAAQQAQRDAAQDVRAQRQEAQFVELAAAIQAPRSKTIIGNLPSGNVELRVLENGIMGNA